MVITASVLLIGLLENIPDRKLGLTYLTRLFMLMYYRDAAEKARQNGLPVSNSRISQILLRIEKHYFRVTPFAPKTLLLFLVYQFISINLVTFLAYWVDKRAAVRGAWRISERNLHALEMLGGWSGALAGQKILHHKNKKKSYRAEFAFVLIMQLGFIAVALHFLGLL